MREAASQPDPFLQRFTTILVAGLVLVGLAVLTRTLLDAAAPTPSGIVEYGTPAPSRRDGATVARYEWERERSVSR